MTLEEFIIGTLLGDASIPKLGKGAINYRWTCGHSVKQLEYLKWKVDFLQKKNLHTGVITKVTQKSPRYISGECVSFHTKSKSDSLFNEYRNLFYKKGVKRIPKIELTPNIISLWYMDDGHLLDIGKTRNSDKIKPKAIFNVHSFNKRERMYLCKQFEKFGIKALLRHKNNEIAISAHSMEKFKNLITVLPMFQYKMGSV